MPDTMDEGEFQFVVEELRAIRGGYAADVKFQLIEMRKTSKKILLKTGTYHESKPGWEIQPETTIQVNCDRAVLKFRLVDKDGDSERYRAVGIGFSRADGTTPMGVACTTAARRPLAMADKKTGSPFHGLKLNDKGYHIQFTDTRIKGAYTKVKAEEQIGEHTHTTYRFMIVIQDRDTGKYGVIDPEVENLN